MKKLIIVLFLISTLANADGERWIAFTEGFWTDHSDKLTEATVKLVNRQSFFTTSDTNNMLHQINFGYKHNALNVGIWGCNVAKFGGYSSADDWQDVKDKCNNDVRVNYGEDVGLVQFMADNGLTHATNQWLTLDIPFVSDANKEASSSPFVVSMACLKVDYSATILTAINIDLLNRPDNIANRQDIINGGAGNPPVDTTTYCYNNNTNQAMYVWHRYFNRLPDQVSDKRIRAARTRIDNNRIKVGAFRAKRQDEILTHYKITKRPTE